MLYIFMILNLLFSFYLLSEVIDLNKKVIRLIQENAIHAFLLEDKNSDKGLDNKNSDKGLDDKNSEKTDDKEK